MYVKSDSFIYSLQFNFPRCSGSSLITSCTDKCNNVNSICTECGRNFEKFDCENDRKSIPSSMNYTCASLSSTTGFITSGSLTSHSVTTGVGQTGSSSSTGVATTGAEPESAAVANTPYFLLFIFIYFTL